MILAILAGLYMVKGKLGKKKGREKDTGGRAGIFNSIKLGGRGRKNKGKDRGSRVGALNSPLPRDNDNTDEGNFVDIDQFSSSNGNEHVDYLGSAMDEE